MCGIRYVFNCSKEFWPPLWLFVWSCSGDLKQVPNGREARVTRERRSVFASSLPPLTFKEAKDLRLLCEPQA